MNLEKIKLANIQNDEIYADYFAKLFGFGEHIKSMFMKHQLCYNNPVRFYDLRIEKINSHDIFNGTLKPINKKGF